MTSKLDQLRAMTTVVADTGDIEAVARLKPVDCTTNPTIVLQGARHADVRRRDQGSRVLGQEAGRRPDAVAAAVADRLAISVGAALSGLVPGRVSTEVDADLSFNTEASIAKARAIIAAYKERGIGHDRILIKLASTWEGIRAAEVLQKEGIDCNLTLLFSKAQAAACADAKGFPDLALRRPHPRLVQEVDRQGLCSGRRSGRSFRSRDLQLLQVQRHQDDRHGRFLP